MGEYHHRRIEKSMHNGGGVNGLEDEYQQAAASSEYIGTLSELRFEDEEKKDSDEQKTVVNTSLDILSTILVTGVTSLTDGAAIPVLELTTGSTILKPVVADKITGALGTSVDGDEDKDRVKGGEQVTSHRKMSIKIILGQLYVAGVQKEDILFIISNG